MSGLRRLADLDKDTETASTPALRARSFLLGILQEINGTECKSVTASTIHHDRSMLNVAVGERFRSNRADLHVHAVRIARW